MTDALFICQNLAERLRDLNEVERLATNSAQQVQGPSSLWQNYSFADGFAGIGYFLLAMDQVSPGEGWEEIAKLHIRRSIDCFKQVNCSLFKGLTGISLPLSCVQDPSDKFRKFREDFDDWLIEEVTQSYLETTTRLLAEDLLIPPFYYGFTSGISGVLAYLVTRDDNPYLRRLAQRCADDLATLMLTKKKGGKEAVQAWYFTQEQLHEVYRSPELEGGYNGSMFYGVTGCLTALSSAALSGIESDSIYRAIEEMACWLQVTYAYVLQEGYWNGVISADREVVPLPANLQDAQNSWLLGWPPVAKSLHLAGKALRRDSLLDFSRNFCSKFIEQEPSFFLGATSLSLGMAGFISTLYPLAEETNNRPLLETITTLTARCANAFDPNSAFGFPQRQSTETEIEFTVDSPTLASGAAGIGLALLIADGRHHCPFFL